MYAISFTIHGAGEECGAREVETAALRERVAELERLTGDAGSGVGRGLRRAAEARGDAGATKRK